MNKVLRVLVALPAILFIVIGLRWAVDPAGAAGVLGMTLLDGLGRSSQIGDVGSYFFCVGAMILLALITARRTWFYAPVLLLLVTAVLRVLAWLVHEAPLAVEPIVLEIVVSGLLLFASSRLARES